MRLLICAGGTGGGVYPALAVLQALQTLYGDRPSRPGAEPVEGDLAVLWVGGAGGIEAGLVERAGVPFEAIPAAGVHGVGLRRLPGNLSQLLRGYQKARQIIQRFRPDVMFFTGGYVAGPVALAGSGVSKALYVPDIEPGLALKFLARFSDRIGLTADPSRQYFPGRKGLQVTGYPTRPDLGAWSRSDAYQSLGLAPDLPTLLVFGGSKGARSINRALIDSLPKLLPEMQVAHISGTLDWPEVQAAQDALAGRVSPDLLPRYHAFAYLHEMGAALAAADLVVSRAGAATLGEFPLFGLPSILVPYPYAWRYQRVNAEYLVERGASVMLRDEELPIRLASTILDLLADVDRLQAMRNAAHSLAHPDAAQAIAEMLVVLASSTQRKRMNS